MRGLYRGRGCTKRSGRDGGSVFWVTFDTLATARSLHEAGMDSAQAEAVADAIRVAVSEDVATKADLAALELRLTWRILGGVGALLAVAVAIARLIFIAP